MDIPPSPSLDSVEASEVDSTTQDPTDETAVETRGESMTEATQEAEQEVMEEPETDPPTDASSSSGVAPPAPPVAPNPTAVPMASSEEDPSAVSPDSPPPPGPRRSQRSRPVSRRVLENFEVGGDSYSVPVVLQNTPVRDTSSNTASGTTTEGEENVVTGGTGDLMDVEEANTTVAPQQRPQRAPPSSSTTSSTTSALSRSSTTSTSSSTSRSQKIPWSRESYALKRFLLLLLLAGRVQRRGRRNHPRKRIVEIFNQHLQKKHPGMRGLKGQKHLNTVVGKWKKEYKNYQEQDSGENLPEPAHYDLMQKFVDDHVISTEVLSVSSSFLEPGQTFVGLFESIEDHHRQTRAELMAIVEGGGSSRVGGATSVSATGLPQSAPASASSSRRRRREGADDNPRRRRVARSLDVSIEDSPTAARAGREGSASESGGSRSTSRRRQQRRPSSAQAQQELVQIAREAQEETRQHRHQMSATLGMLVELLAAQQGRTIENGRLVPLHHHAPPHTSPPTRHTGRTHHTTTTTSRRSSGRASSAPSRQLTLSPASASPPPDSPHSPSATAESARNDRRNRPTTSIPSDELERLANQVLPGDGEDVSPSPSPLPPSVLDTNE